jgi:arabinoxylan arabinofuranohydrolase
MKTQDSVTRMVGAGALCMAVCLSLTASAWAQKLVTPGYLFNDDPTCRELNGKFYLFTTQDPFTVQFERMNEFYKGMSAFRALSTSDFDHWTDHGSIVTGRDVTWNTGDALWDGDAGIPANGKFYSYAPYRINPATEDNYGIFDIGVLTADNPLGPYKDVVGGPMKNSDGTPVEGLSPWVVYSDDKVPYLMWGAGDTSKNWVKMARLTPDMTQLAEPARDVVVTKTDACGNIDYFESPILFKAREKWYLTYVAYKKDKGPGCDPKGDYIDYVVSDSMFGPFNGPVRHLIYPTEDGDESVQQGICTYKGKTYIAYHVPYDNGATASNVPESWNSTTHDHHRQVAVTLLTILPDGGLQPIYPGHDQGVGTPGVTHLTLDAFAPRREAVEFHVEMNAWGEKGLKGEYQMKMGDGGYLQYHDVDFGDGAATFHVEVSSENAALRNGLLEVRLDNPAGELIGEVKIADTGGRTNYRILTTNVLPSARGVHDLCLVARGEATTAQRRLFNITSFGFTRH